MRVSVVIPTLNEKPVIGSGLGKVPRDLLHEIIVVDKGSADRTAALASAGGAEQAIVDRMTIIAVLLAARRRGERS
ncbi:MAG: glycosyltransferase [Candidatus Rokuibacteriota bacterium]